MNRQAPALAWSACQATRLGRRSSGRTGRMRSRPSRGALDPLGDRARRMRRVFLVLAHICEGELVQLAGTETVFLPADGALVDLPAPFLFCCCAHALPPCSLPGWVSQAATFRRPGLGPGLSSTSGTSSSGSNHSSRQWMADPHRRLFAGVPPGAVLRRLGQLTDLAGLALSGKPLSTDGGQAPIWLAPPLDTGTAAWVTPRRKRRRAPDRQKAWLGFGCNTTTNAAVLRPGLDSSRGTAPSLLCGSGYGLCPPDA